MVESALYGTHRREHTAMVRDCESKGIRKEIHTKAFLTYGVATSNANLGEDTEQISLHRNSYKQNWVVLLADLAEN